MKIFKRPENMDKKLYYLIITSFTMDKEEKKEWLDLYNQMDKDQLNRLYLILTNERVKKQKLEKKYNSEIRDMNLKHLLEWQKPNE
jgi:predicted protein tyrosine phosphatase